MHPKNVKLVKSSSAKDQAYKEYFFMFPVLDLRGNMADVEEVPVLTTTRVTPVKLLLDPDPSEGLVQAERVHTMATLNVLADTIDLAPSEPTSLFIPRATVDSSLLDREQSFCTSRC